MSTTAKVRHGFGWYASQMPKPEVLSQSFRDTRPNEYGERWLQWRADMLAFGQMFYPNETERERFVRLCTA